MKNSFAILLVMIESGLMAGLVWRHRFLYSVHVPFILFVISPFLALAHWKALSKERIAPLQRRTLFFLTGPAVLLCLSLVLSLFQDFKIIRILGGISKEMQAVASRELVQNECLRQWTSDAIKKMNSELQIYIMLLASIFLLYITRWSMASREPPAIRRDSR